jgi:cbb3-type cytochrome oxidase subunit 1
MNGATTFWRWTFVVVATMTAISFIFEPSREWALHDLNLSIPVSLAGIIFYSVVAMGVVLRRRWAYVCACVASCLALFFLCWINFGYPKHSAPSALAFAWMICLLSQLGPIVKHQFLAESK